MFLYVLQSALLNTNCQAGKLKHFKLQVQFCNGFVAPIFLEFWQPKEEKSSEFHGSLEIVQIAITIGHIKSEQKKGQVQKLAITKKSTIFLQSLRNLVKMITS